MTLPDRVTALIASMRAQGVSRLDIESGGERLMLRLASQAEVAAPTSVASDGPVAIVRSPELGVFTACAPGGDRRVDAGAIVGFVVAGELRLPVWAGRAGMLGPALLPDGAVAGYGARLFEIED